MAVRLSGREKLVLIRRFLAGERISALCRELNISRTIFYSWLRVYQSFDDHKAVYALSNRPVGGRTHYRYVSQSTRTEIALYSLRNPLVPIRVLATRFGLSRHCVWTILHTYNLSTYRSRNLHISLSGTRIIPLISSSTKSLLLGRFEAGEKISALSEEFGVSRTSIYIWLHSSSGDTLKSDKRESLKGMRHYRYNNEARVELLRIVTLYPRFSIRQLQNELCKSVGKKVVSRHLVHMFLIEKNLNSIDKRLAFKALSMPIVS